MKNMKSKLWIDLINPSDVLFFRSLLLDLNKYDIFVSLRDRAETIDLARSFDINGKIIGADYQEKFKKLLSVAYRTIQLQRQINKFDYALSFEDGMSVTVSRLRKKKSLLFCDNDLKFLQKKSFFQDVEMKIKSFADYIIVPEACSETFSNHLKKGKIVSYPGFKEDVYIADFMPDPDFVAKIPFQDYIVVRPEALGSFYVKETKSIVPELIKAFNEKHINIVYLPRDKEDIAYVKKFNVHIPRTVLNGLDLCYHAKAVLTGSGTLAREAACIGKTAISFFPSKTLLSVDQQLVNENKILHSRNVEEILNYVILKKEKKQKLKLEKCMKVKNNVLDIIKDCLDGDKK